MKKKEPLPIKARVIYSPNDNAEFTKQVEGLIVEAVSPLCTRMHLVKNSEFKRQGVTHPTCTNKGDDFIWRFYNGDLVEVTK